MCEASAAAELAPGKIVVADDEDNVLRIYATNGGTPAVADDAVLSFLDMPTKEGSDIEGAARVGDRIYWITSHSLTKKGKAKEGRSAFFATDIIGSPTAPGLRQAGRPYLGLRALLVGPSLPSRWELADAALRAPESGLRRDDADAPAPPPDSIEARRRAEGGLNVEGLAARHGGGLLVGLRSPVRGRSALIFTLTRPDTTIGAGGAVLAEPTEVDLGGFGVRSIERIGDTDDYLIAAGPVSGGASFRLYRWRLGHRTARRLRPPPRTLRPEAAVLPAGMAGQALLLSDDGDFPTDGACGLPARHFRGILQPMVAL